MVGLNPGEFRRRRRNDAAVRWSLCYICILMSRPICNSTEHLFTPVLEVTIPLLRCVRCNVYAYHETVKQLAKNRAYKGDHDETHVVPASIPYWRRMWLGIRRTFRVA